MRIALRAVILFMLAFAAFLLTGFYNAMQDPLVRTHTVPLADLPRSQPPIRIALLSDIHVGNIAMRRERLEKVVGDINAAKPDIVVITGDFVVGESKAGTALIARDLSPLGALRARFGVFATMGNHDLWTDPQAIKQELANANVTILENGAVRAGPITLVGISDRFSGHDDISAAFAKAKALGGTPVVASHSPDIAPEIAGKASLLLAGHTHCGQMVLPLIGPLVRYSRWQRLYNPRYRCGRIEDGGLTTIVTAGVGTGAVPVRVGAPTDWWLISIAPPAMSQ